MTVRMNARRMALVGEVLRDVFPDAKYFRSLEAAYQRMGNLEQAELCQERAKACDRAVARGTLLRTFSRLVLVS